jgi:hypothetical protein
MVMEIFVADYEHAHYKHGTSAAGNFKEDPFHTLKMYQTPLIRQQ